MEFTKVLEERLQEKIKDKRIKILKADYVKAGSILRMYCISDSELSVNDEDSMTSLVVDIFGEGINCEYSYVCQNEDDDPEKMETVLCKARDLLKHDPLAKTFFKEAECTYEGGKLSCTHYNELLVSNLQNKNISRLIHDAFMELWDKEIEIELKCNNSNQPDIKDEPIRIEIKVPEKKKEDKKAEDKPKYEKKKLVAPPITGSNKMELKASADDESILYGKAIKDEAKPIGDLTEGLRNICISGEIFKVEDRELRSGKVLKTLFVYDRTGSIVCKMFTEKGEAGGIKPGIYAKLKGSTGIDTYTKEFCLNVNHVQKLEKIAKKDNYEEKRAELHAHTFMSAMDSVVSAKALIDQAIAWGHKSIAITDHGVVQAFPEAMNSAKGKIKVVYGVEAYMVDDISPLCDADPEISLDGDYVVFDLETVGFSHVNDRIIEIGAVRVVNGTITDRYSTFVDPKMKLPAKIVELTKIKDEMVEGQRTIDEVLPEFLEFAKDSVLVAHNANFDMGFVRTNAKNLGLPFENAQLDTVSMARYLLPELKRHKLDTIAKHLNIFMGSHHRAVDDAETTAQILLKFFESLKAKGITNIGELNEAYRKDFDVTKYMPSHAVLLAKNKAGLKAMYEMVSESHLKHFNKNPRIPKSLIMKNRENLLIGSACSNGEVFKSILEGRSEKDIVNYAKDYDYLEIMPVLNNKYLIDEGRCSEGQIREINSYILNLGDRLGIPVVATGDVHMLNKEDEIFRRIIKYSQGFSNDTSESPLPFYSTEEMMKEFSYLGKEDARRVVIKNSNLIADMTETFDPIPKETFPPKMEGSEDKIRNMAIANAKKKYGDELPEIVQARLNRELDSIIGHGYAVLYLVAHMLVKKSLDDGYLVGSRGSVGSSLVATFTDITEVNGLPAHYVCPECKYSEFPEAKGSSGVDLPDKVCPVCGHMMNKDGHDIPFETFLGFNGDKEPDIDLNFSGEYQPVVHKYCEEIFGTGFTFRAGTIGTVAEKTAMGYVKKYYEEHDLPNNRAEMERLASGCTGIKRTTGQHPGGIMVVPSDNDIHNFCPVQHPADDNDTEIITTHFDYHSISGKLLKLDILGHDDPTMLKMLQDITGIDPKTIPLNDPKVLSLFESPEALGVTAEELDCPVGTYGIPEFGTKFVRQMLLDTKPKSFSDLVRVSGLSHGTDVWLNNAQYYIKEGKTDLEGCISLRDNIMLYLISKDLPKKESFFITERVRKGKGLTPDDEALMREHNVPEWYIESCKKIKYMFPKGHAVAYVTMAVRVGWYKVYRPLHYYATYFTVRAKDFDLELALKGENTVRDKLNEIIKAGNDASQKDQTMIPVLELIYEMYKRGYSFTDLDLYRSHASRFIVDGDKLIPPFNSVAGVGDNAALAIYEETQKGEFMSKEDFKKRTKATRTVMEALETTGCFDGLNETNQITFF